MTNPKNLFSARHIVSGIVMLLALVWLTVSTPFVYADGLLKKGIIEKGQCDAAAEDDHPASGTTEEKTGSSNPLSEFLHQACVGEQHFIIITRLYKCHSDAAYPAYHPELISPPPEA